MLADRPWWQRLLRLLTLESAVLDGWGDPVPAASGRSGRPPGAMATSQLARTCRDLLRRAGAETRRGRGDRSVPPELRARGVTSREMDVLRLVAEGLSNRRGGQPALPLPANRRHAMLPACWPRPARARRSGLRDLVAGPTQ